MVGRRRLLVLAVVALTAGVAAAMGQRATVRPLSPAAQGRTPAAVTWAPTGLSGGGAMFAPSISPADPRRMMVNCDMSGAYVSEDGGRTWTMIHCTQLRASIRCRPGFHPSDARTVYAADGWGGLKASRDGGRHWTPIGDLPGDLRGEVAIDPDRPARMLVGAGERVYRSEDAGSSWKRCEGPEGDAIAFHFDRTSPPGSRVCFAATTSGIWRSDDSGATWRRSDKGLPGWGILGFAGGSNAGRRVVVLYCTVERREQDGAWVGGVYRSADRGVTWEPANGTGLNLETVAFDEWAMGSAAQYHRVVTSDARPETVYALNSNTGIPPPHHASVYRSDDAGRTWRATFYGDPRWPGCNVEPDYTVVEDGQFYQDVARVAACATDPERLLLVDAGNCWITEDGGRGWRCGHARRVEGTPARPGARWRNTGLVVTSTWNYAIDPHDHRRHTICYTDIGMARSLDDGRTWSWWSLRGRAPWRNTCYEVAFDPSKPGRMWGAFSDVHDIPNDNIISERHRSVGPGGICVSDDHGATWRPLGGGLPVAPATSIVVDARSAPDHRRLYAGFFGAGVWRSEDGGATWMAVNRGLADGGARRVCRVALHADGTLFALVTAKRDGRRFVAEGPGLYRSRDRGATWTLVNASRPLLWPKDFTVDPRSSRTVYLSACDANGEEQGGLWRTQDGGATWTRLARRGPEHFGAYLHPRRPGWITMTLTEGAPGVGLWLSRDNGATWRPVYGLPFANAQRVAFDPDDPDRIYVTTFGGSVWTGPAAE